jgi:predicted ribosome quality control (RQC) complex YloA/Tae2 family protein
MKHYQLHAIAKRLAEFSYITRARRVEDNTIEISFEKHHSYFFVMTRGSSMVYKAPAKRPLQGYNAPFDTLLHGLLSHAKLLSVDAPNEDRILRFTLAPKSSYKDKIIYFQLEFTGKNTNAILIDENECVIEALRHIDSESSFRVVRPLVELLPIPAIARRESVEVIEDIDAYLEEASRRLQAQRVHQDQKARSTHQQAPQQSEA